MSDDGFVACGWTLTNCLLLAKSESHCAMGWVVRVIVIGDESSVSPWVWGWTDGELLGSQSSVSCP